MVQFYLGDTTRRGDVSRCTRGRSFNLVITSPPYGDSRSTVSYGGVSSLCLGVLQHIPALRLPFIGSYSLDAKCLGGKPTKDGCEVGDLNHYWGGGVQNPARERVVRFLADFDRSCTQLVSVLDQKQEQWFVVSRRKVAGRRLYGSSVQQREFQAHSNANAAPTPDPASRCTQPDNRPERHGEGLRLPMSSRGFRLLRSPSPFSLMQPVICSDQVSGLR